MLIKKDLYLKYNIFSIDNNVEGILGVQFVNKATEYNFVIFACYTQRRVQPDQCYFTVQITGINFECSLLNKVDPTKPGLLKLEVTDC